jgi:hypothetical protein
MAVHDKSLSEQLRAFLRSRGADLVGFGRSVLLEGAPENLRPTRYLPDARALVSIALHINEAACELIARSADQGETPPSYYSYQWFTLGVINRKLDELAYEGASFLEEPASSLHSHRAAHPGERTRPARIRAVHGQRNAAGLITRTAFISASSRSVRS